jgi:hypothetical protein
VRFDVEYLDPEPGTMSIHYDALDESNPKDSAYRSAGSTRLTGSKQWQEATFRTRGDAIFSNRQNGQSDFRISATTPVLYLRRVTVTRETAPVEKLSLDFSRTNQVSVVLGEEKPEDGVRHLFEERDGITAVTNLNGVMCRELNRTGDGKSWGFVYFQIDPSFTRSRLTNARVEIEYFARRNNYFRLQFDGMRDGANRHYIAAMPVGARVMRWGNGLEQARIPTTGTWAVAMFPLTNVVFRHGQNGGADFRLEVASPAELFLRRVTVVRADRESSAAATPALEATK